MEGDCGRVRDEHDDNKAPVWKFLQGEMDFINSVCPCAGLSMLNRTRDGKAARGADAVQNAWMLKSAQYWPEFAPRCLLL